MPSTQLFLSNDRELELTCLALLASAFAHDLAQPMQKLVSTVEDFEDFALTGKLTADNSAEFRVKLMHHLEDIGRLTSSARTLFRKYTQFPQTELDAIAALTKSANDFHRLAKFTHVKCEISGSNPSPKVALHPGFLDLSIQGIMDHCLTQALASPNPKVSIQADQQDTMARIQFFHSGAWPNEREVPFFFKAFNESQPHPEKLRLSLSKAAAQQARGSLTLEETPKGKCLVLRLPSQITK